MKSLGLYASATFIFALLFSTSCVKQQEITVNEVNFDTINIAKNYHLDNDSTQPSCNLKINFVYPVSYADKEMLKTIQSTFLTHFFDKHYEGMPPLEAIEKYSTNYIDNYKEDARIFFKEKVEERSEDGAVDNYFSYFETIENDVKYNKAGLLAFQVVQTNYKGGQNSYKHVNNHVINLKNGKLLTEEDIFKPGYEKALNAIFKDKLKKENKVDNIYDLEDLGYFGIEEMMPNNNFLVDDNGITYIFNKNEYSVLQLNEIVISLPYEEIELVLKDESPVTILFDK